jgi:predicted type IV restriction endonuclease
MTRLTAEQKAWRAITEREWQSQVQRIASSLGWKFYHAPDNKPINGRIQKVVAGFPDLVLVKGDRLVFAELKRELGIVADAQLEWLAALTATGAECYVWRPSDMRKVHDTLTKKP